MTPRRARSPKPPVTSTGQTAGREAPSAPSAGLAPTSSATQPAGQTHETGHAGQSGVASATGLAGVRHRTRSRKIPEPDEMIALARAAHQQLRGPIRRREFLRMTGIKDWQLCRAFVGGWTELRERAGIPRHPKDIGRYALDELLAEYHRVACELGRIPRWLDLDRLSRMSPRPYQARFGRKRELVVRYATWLKQHEPDSPLLDLCARELADRNTGRERRTRLPGRAGRQVRVLGEPINFRGLHHAPTNELGVIFLFGMLAEELGFTVQRMSAGFPDCEANRALNASRTRWERVRIEFEHRSRNFRDHCHDPAGCDLIVCWRHDWPECPVEVLELASTVRAAA